MEQNQNESLLEKTLYRNAQPVNNSVATLVLGILSIVSCMAYGIPSLILGIIALAISSRPKKDYLDAPELYDRASYNLLNAGRVCAIVGLSLSAFFWLLMILAVAFTFSIR